MSTVTPNVPRGESRIEAAAAAAAAAATAARTPTVAPLIPASGDLVTMHQQTFQSICQQYVDEEGWTAEQQRVLGEAFTNFAHNLFATVRKNVTSSASASASTSGGAELSEPLDRQLVADVEATDAKLDALSSRLKVLRAEVPQITEQFITDMLASPQQSDAAPADAAAAAVDEEGPQADLTRVLAHVSSEVQRVSEAAIEHVKAVETALETQSTVDAVRAVVGKDISATQQVGLSVIVITAFCFCFNVGICSARSIVRLLLVPRRTCVRLCE